MKGNDISRSLCENNKKKVNKNPIKLSFCNFPKVKHDLWCDFFFNQDLESSRTVMRSMSSIQNKTKRKKNKEERERHTTQEKKNDQIPELGAK